MIVLARGQVEVASWPLRVTGHLDLDAVGELARLQLAARRLGCSIRLREPCLELLELLELVGLADVVNPYSTMSSGLGVKGPNWNAGR